MSFFYKTKLTRKERDEKIINHEKNFNNLLPDMISRLKNLENKIEKLEKKVGD